MNFAEDKDEEVMKGLAERVCKTEFDHYAARENLKRAATLETVDAFNDVSIYQYLYSSNSVTDQQYSTVLARTNCQSTESFQIQRLETIHDVCQGSQPYDCSVHYCSERFSGEYIEHGNSHNDRNG